MSLRLSLFLLSAVILLSIANAAKCSRHNLHACLGGNGKRSSMDVSNRDEQLMKILSRGLDQRAIRSEIDDDTVLPLEKSYERAVKQNDFAPVIKRLAKIILSEESQN
ncbi:Hypothetical predicted protein [Octopus vulgaris]|uniref:Uncharacterized protein n=1 Tax=Octopus vulgaris TaxID=6645 RepID=A0AA36B2Z9_OCTVU|nr:Hypothetical predicted protein [Octopus vulgaris]